MKTSLFLTELAMQITAREHFRQDDHKLNEGSVGGWITKERKGFTVKHGERYFALKWHREEQEGAERVTVLVLPLSDRQQIAGSNQTATLRSENEEDGNFFMNVVSNKPERRAAVENAFGGRDGFPRFEKGRVWLGPITSPEFLSGLFDVSAVAPIRATDAQEIPPAYWAGGFQWDDESKLDEFMRGNHWRMGWKATDPNPTAQRCWNSFREIRVGDWFAIKGYGGRNDLKVHYVGRVENINLATAELSLTPQPDIPLFRGKAPSIGAGGNWRITLTPLLSPEAIGEVFGGEKPVLTTPPTSIDPNELNTILYGPPGTGKTYEAVRRSVRIVDGSLRSDHSDIQQRFQQLCREGQISLVTFHQSYSYEDFIEGIRPVMSDEEGSGSAQYEIASGIFSRITVEAMFDCLEPTNPTAIADFEDRWSALIDQIETEPDKTYPGLTQASEFRLSVTPRGHIFGENVKTRTNLRCSKSYLESVYRAFQSRTSVSTTDVRKAVGHHTHAGLIAAVFEQLQHVKVTPSSPVVVQHDDKAAVVQRFLQSDAASGYRMKQRDAWRPYVLVIDEINRGNISKIFGELITLIEPDKRIGGAVQLVATLPYSRSRLGVPPNFFLLGTMNTADKSLALLDVALRRRFLFEELQPTFSVETCPHLPDDLRRLVETLNARIALRKDRDHLIGHAYFTDVGDSETFNKVFGQKIVPLLQEYFFNDWDGLRTVLGEHGGGGESGFIRRLEKTKSPWARNQWQWFHDLGEQIAFDEVLAVNFKVAPIDNSELPDPPSNN